MTESDVSHEVRAFIAERIDSVVQLEVLLLTHADPARSWTAAAVAEQLRIDSAWAAGQLNELAARGLLSPSQDSENGGFRYAPATPELGSAVAQLAKDYAERRVTIITLIFSKPADTLRSFADAFRLRKDKP